jgi:Zn-dependent protease
VIAQDLTIQLAVLRFLAGLLIAGVQGFAIAATAVLLGDKGPRYDGRLTLLPFRHIDLIGIASLILTGFGWSKFVAIEAAQLRIGRWGLVIAALAGSVALLALAWLLLLLVVPILSYLPYTAGLTGAAFVRLAARLCVWLALFALLPIPPLAGGHFLEAIGIRLPPTATVWLGWGLLVASILGVTGMVLAPAYRLVAPLVLGVETIR